MRPKEAIRNPDRKKNPLIRAYNNECISFKEYIEICHYIMDFRKIYGRSPKIIKVREIAIFYSDFLKIDRAVRNFEHICLNHPDVIWLHPEPKPKGKKCSRRDRDMNTGGNPPSS